MPRNLWVEVLGLYGSLYSKKSYIALFSIEHREWENLYTNYIKYAALESAITEVKFVYRDSFFVIVCIEILLRSFNRGIHKATNRISELGVTMENLT